MTTASSGGIIGTVAGPPAQGTGAGRRAGVSQHPRRETCLPDGSARQHGRKMGPNGALWVRRVTGEAIRLARYRLSTTFGRRWPGYLSLALLIGLVGGLSMGSIAGARRTDSSFTVFWKSTNPSDLIGATGILNPTLPLTPYDGPLVFKISHLPHVKSVETQSGINILPLQPDGAPEQNVTEFSPGPGNGYGSVDGLYFNQDKVTVIAGRMADPATPDQF